MVVVTYPNNRRSKFWSQSKVSVGCTCVIVTIIIMMMMMMMNNNNASSTIQEEQQVLNQFYQNEKQVLSHMIHGHDKISNGNNNNNDNSNDKDSQLFTGWKPIHIFYGDDKHLAYLGRQSQVGQDKLIMSLLNNPQNGYFIDLAANDATNLSNTYQLEKQLNWNGICIEPNPIYWTSLSHRKCHVVAAVIGKTRMAEIQFRMYPDLKKRAPSGGIEGYIDPGIPRSKEKSVDLYTVPFYEILQKFKSPTIIDYLSLDVEGSEFLVMEAFPFHQYKFKVMTIERPRQNLVDLLLSHDYLYLAANNIDGMETVWIHKSMENSIHRDAIQEHGWIVGDTKWIQIKNDGKKLHVNDPTAAKNQKKRGEGHGDSGGNSSNDKSQNH